MRVGEGEDVKVQGICRLCPTRWKSFFSLAKKRLIEKICAGHQAFGSESNVLAIQKEQTINMQLIRTGPERLQISPFVLLSSETRGRGLKSISDLQGKKKISNKVERTHL